MEIDKNSQFIIFSSEIPFNSSNSSFFLAFLRTDYDNLAQVLDFFTIFAIFTHISLKKPTFCVKLSDFNASLPIDFLMFCGFLQEKALFSQYLSEKSSETIKKTDFSRVLTNLGLPFSEEILDSAYISSDILDCEVAYRLAFTQYSKELQEKRKKTDKSQ